MSKSNSQALNHLLTLEAGALGTPSGFSPEKDQPSHVQEMHRRKEYLDRLLDKLSRQRALFRGSRVIQVPVWPFAYIVYAQGGAPSQESVAKNLQAAPAPNLRDRSPQPLSSP